MRELEGRGIVMCSLRDTKGRSLDSLSDLTNIDFDMDFSQCDKERLVFLFRVEYCFLELLFGKARKIF